MAGNLLYAYCRILLLIITVVTVITGLIILSHKGYDFPVQINTNALSNFLNYYISSDSLFTTNLYKDNQGVVYNDYGLSIGNQYNPAYIAWYGLLSLEKYLSTNDEDFLANFNNQLDWIVSNYRDWGDRGIVWTYDFDWQENNAFLQAPWVSAMAQGLAISILTRGYRLTGDNHLLDIALNATRVFELDISCGGVKEVEGNCVFYEEYPSYPLARILDGFIFSLLGLHDLWLLTKDVKIEKLFIDGCTGLSRNLNFWNYRNKWSWYGSHGYLCPALYNRLNVELLKVMYQITGINDFSEKAREWAPDNMRISDKIEILILQKIGRYRMTLNRILRNLN